MEASRVSSKAEKTAQLKSPMKLELYHVQQINVICEILRKKRANQEF